MPIMWHHELQENMLALGIYRIFPHKNLQAITDEQPNVKKTRAHKDWFLEKIFPNKEEAKAAVASLTWRKNLIIETCLT